ncbi:MAG: S-layer homology domain-containing protein [Clostridia bacterium]|nr:S-layer homology domain-containing protein [Clostridia bacterium]
MTYLNKLKTICLALVLAVLAGSMPVFASSYTDVYSDDSYADAVSRLGDLGIINGYEDGSFRPSDTLTRAQFAKIVVCAMDKEDEAIANGVSSSFYDVDQYYWAAPYINYVSQNSIIIGYADGSFAPEQPITFAEAVTVLLRLLGYSESDVGYYWPKNYVDKAYALGITSGIYIDSNDAINRATAAILIDNVLFTDINVNKTSSTNSTSSASATKEPLIATVGYTVIEDSIVLATGADDESLQWNEIKLGDGSIYKYTTTETFEPASIIKYIVIDDDNNIVAVKGNLKGEAGASEMESLGYTVLRNCHIIATSSEDKTLSSSEVRTSYGVYTTANSDVLSLVGEYGTVILNKSRKIISASTKDAPYKEYIVSEVNSSGIKYVSENKVETVDISADFPIYVDYESKKSFSSVLDKITAGAKLTLYSEDNAFPSFGVLDTNAGYSVFNDCFIIATKAEDKSLSSDEVRTSNGTYSVKSNDILTKAGQMGTVVLNSSNKIEQFAPSDLKSLSVVANKLTNNTLEYITDSGAKGSYKFDNTFVVYEDYEKSTYSKVSSEITSGTEITFYGESYGNWSFAVIENTDDIEPILATKAYSDSDTTIGNITIKKDGLIVYRNGEAAKLSDIQKNDVVYYNTKTNTMDVYSKKVTGIYYEALPSKAYVTSVTVGGNTYEIGTTAATAKLDASSGSYAIGDRVTLLLGKDDKVVFVVELSDDDMYNYGVLVNTYSETVSSGDNQGKTEIKAKMFMPDGGTYEYVTDKDYSDYKGSLVKLSFEGGVAKITKISSSGAYGEIDKSSRTIGGKTVLKDASIMQLVSNEDNEDAVVELLKFDTLDVNEITSSQLITSVSTNKFGDIMILYVKNVALSSSYKYGILTGVTFNYTGSASNGTQEFKNAVYKITIGAETQSYTLDSKYSVTAGLPVAVKIVNGEVEDMFNLYQYDSDISIDAIDGSRIMIDGITYSLASDVVYYSVSSSGKYSAISYNELENAKLSSVTIYSDRSKASNGTIKVVVVRMK